MCVQGRYLYIQGGCFGHWIHIRYRHKGSKRGIKNGIGRKLLPGHAMSPCHYLLHSIEWDNNKHRMLGKQRHSIPGRQVKRRGTEWCRWHGLHCQTDANAQCHSKIKWPPPHDYLLNHPGPPLHFVCVCVCVCKNRELGAAYHAISFTDWEDHCKMTQWNKTTK